MIKDKQTIIIFMYGERRKRTNLALKFKISKQRITDIHKNRGEIRKFPDSVKTNEGLKIHKYLQSIHKFK